MQSVVVGLLLVLLGHDTHASQCCNMPHTRNTPVVVDLSTINATSISHSPPVTFMPGWQVEGWQRETKWLTTARKQTGIYEHDGGFSVRQHQDGTHDYQSVWLFGDTFMSKGGGLQNSALRFNRTGNVIRASFSSGSNGKASCIVPVVAPDGCHNGYHNWPAGGVALNNTAYAYFTLLPPHNGVKHTTLFAASFSENPMNWTQVVMPTTKLPTLYGIVQYGSHNYGYYFTATNDHNHWAVRVARFFSADIANPSRYEYYNSVGGWTRSMNSSTALGVTLSALNPQMDVVYMERLGVYVMLLTNFWQHSLWLSVAEHPWGPWSKPVQTYKQNTGNNPWYAAYWHPEMGGVLPGGKISLYATFSHGGHPGVPSLAELVFSKA
eukprot:TRINITY_DN19511_c0_g1_i1.p1 TRINITY_DN19511_c0_g1~~TRINITY_DN19511_c0_g1_i1.p1  ORF type:complete len:380 (+),score=36.10 TRINITY_DN19511_c0_g1_i1:22-1161(+)